MSYEELDEIIRKMQTIHEKALEYKKTKKISNYSKEIYSLSTTTIIAIIINIINPACVLIIKTFEILSIVLLGLTMKKHIKLKMKRNKIEKEYPKINFNKYDINENQKTIMRLLKQKMQYAKAEKEKTRMKKKETSIQTLVPVNIYQKAHVKSIGTLKRRG